MAAVAYSREAESSVSATSPVVMLPPIREAIPQINCTGTHDSVGLASYVSSHRPVPALGSAVGADPTSPLPSPAQKRLKQSHHRSDRDAARPDLRLETSSASCYASTLPLRVADASTAARGGNDGYSRSGGVMSAPASTTHRNPYAPTLRSLDSPLDESPVRPTLPSIFGHDHRRTGVSRSADLTFTHRRPHYETGRQPGERASYGDAGPRRMDGAAYSPLESHESVGEGGGGTPGKKRRGNLPKPTTDVLKAWFYDHIGHPYPNEKEKQELMLRTQLSMSQLSNWFINCRRRHLPLCNKQMRGQMMVQEQERAECYVLLVDAEGMPEAFQELVTRWEIQKRRFVNWGDVAGLADESGSTLAMSLRVNRALVLDILSEIKRRFDGFEKLTGRYESLDSVQEVNRERAEEQARVEDGIEARTTPKSGSRLERRFQKTLKKFTDAIEYAPSAPKRLRWASLDQDRFREQLEQLGQLNDYLQSLLDESRISELVTTQNETLMGVLQLQNTVAGLEQLIGALRLTSPQRTLQGLAGSPVIERQRQDQARVAALARFKELNLCDEPTNTQIDRGRLELSDDSHEGRANGLFLLDDGSKRSVWIEWKDYEPEICRVGFEPHPKILERVRHLTALLMSDKPDMFRAPQCLGYFDDRECGGAHRFGFVFARPDSPHLFSLLELFTRAKPSLSERLSLARQLASCMLYLHSVNWLHKGLRSHNVLFLAPTTVCLSGFDFARPAHADELTEKPPPHPAFDVYRHPEAHGAAPLDSEAPRPFKKSYDVYALGVVLLELALWQPVHAVLDIADIQAARPAVTRGVQERLLAQDSPFLARVRAAAGDAYAEVVRTCLRGGEAFGVARDDPETAEAVAADLQQAFAERVVDRLEELRI
ncbi:MAG: hypothetical protein M1832_002651 [Thelocarpon impressellum]|nr:MAG: hypothetical protein M1832_002651 [Thelocarpon impressellum]